MIFVLHNIISSIILHIEVLRWRYKKTLIYEIFTIA